MRALIFLLMLVPTLAYAQVNTEVLRRGGPKGHTGFSSRSSIKGDYSTGNVDSSALGAKLRFDYQLGDHHFFSYSEGEYGSSDKGVFKESGFSHLRWSALWYDDMGTDLFVQGQYDRFRNLKLRALAGGGFRMVGSARKDYPQRPGALGTDTAYIWAVGVGAMAEYEELRDGDGDGLVLRSTNYATLVVDLDEGHSFTATAYYQPKFQEISDYRVTLDFTLESTLFGIDYLLAGPVFTYRYDSRPPAGVERQDTVLKYVLTFRY